MEKRLLLAFALSFLIIVLSRPLWETPKPLAPISSSQSPTAGRNVELPKSPVKPNPASSVQVTVDNKHADSERLLEVETELYRLVLTNQGVAAKSWILKRYKDSHGNPLNLIDGKEGGGFGYPLAVEIDGDEELSKTMGKALFVTEAPSRVALTRDGGSRTISFEFIDRNLRSQKNLTFRADSYLVNVTCKVWMNGKPCGYYLHWSSGFGDSTVDQRTAVHRALYRGDQKVTRLDASKIESEQENLGSFDYAGVEDQYFAAIFFPALSSPIRRIQLSRQERSLENGEKQVLPRVGVYRDAQHDQEFSLFVGPKDTEVLQKAGSNLVELIDYGWFAVVCKPLLVALKWIHSYVKNYGLAIITLTVLINLALFPLRYKSILSAQKMQKVQPQMKAIQEKYKKLKATDPKKQQMNAEVMALYKEHGVNPLGGCLPLLLQMPFFIAFYNLLSVSIELRHAPFMLWIRDLSASDHTFILPVLMTVSMMAMQKMTPSPGMDAVQAKMMLAMPIVFGVMLAFTSSGLVLYWLTSNVVGIVQQYVMNKYGPGSPARSSPKRGKKK